MLRDPVEVLDDVRGVDDQQVILPIAGRLEAADEHVVQDPATVVRDERVADAAQREVGHAPAQQPVQKRGGIIAFAMDNIHPHDVAQILDREGICVRAGHHCAMPLHEYYGLSATTRASFYIYTVPEEIDKLVDMLGKVRRVFKV